MMAFSAVAGLLIEASNELTARPSARTKTKCQRPSEISSGELRVDEFAEMMDEEEVGFLAGGTAFTGDDELAGREALGLAAAPAEEREALETELRPLMQSGEDVGGVPAGSQHDDEVARVLRGRRFAAKKPDRSHSRCRCRSAASHRRPGEGGEGGAVFLVAAAGSVEK